MHLLRGGVCVVCELLRIVERLERAPAGGVLGRDVPRAAVGAHDEHRLDRRYVAAPSQPRVKEGVNVVRDGERLASDGGRADRGLERLLGALPGAPEESARLAVEQREE